MYLSTNLQLSLKLLTGTRRKGKRRTGIARGTSREMPQGTPREYLRKCSGLPLQNSSLIFSLSLHGAWWIKERHLLNDCFKLYFLSFHKGVMKTVNKWSVIEELTYIFTWCLTCISNAKSNNHAQMEQTNGTSFSKPAFPWKIYCFF